jgi:RNA polymerase sigma-70 factor (ECF subfamily)
MPDASIFEAARPRLLGLAYRILGSRADAEDAVQDTYLQWQRADGIENHASWLTTTCTRRCLDLLRSAHRSRVEYVGAWLPEPIPTATVDPFPPAETLQTAFLLMLERLTPKERAAYLLHDIFDVPYVEIAATLELGEHACRKLVSRARAHLEGTRVRHVTPRERQNELLAAFENAIANGETHPFAEMLADDIELAADGGGLVPTISRVLVGKAEVLGYVRKVLHRFWSTYEPLREDLNGGPGLMIRNGTGEIIAAFSFVFDKAGSLRRIYLVRNPRKLARL